MTATKKYDSVKRFGSRYGRRIREKVAKIEQELRKKHTCPYCSYKQVKRLAAGIWYCKKCSTRFTGKAYSPVKRIELEVEEKS